MKLAIAASILLLGAGCASSTPSTDRGEMVDLILAHGTVVTISGPVIEDGAVAVSEGAIVAVGPSADILSRYSSAQTVDVAGTAVMPGLVNTHTHAPMSLFRGIADDRDLMDWLQNFIFPAEARNVDRDFVRWGTRLAAAEMIASGTTTFADMYYWESDIADEIDAIGMRAILGQTLIDFPAPDYKTWEDATAGVERFVERWKGHPRITPALAPHAPFTVSAEHLKEVRALATRLGVPILIHVAETQDEGRQVAERSGGKSPVAYLESLDFLGRDVLAAHAVWVDDADIAILARRGVGVAHNPESNMMLASGVAPVPQLRAARVPVGIGTDGPAGSNNNFDMFEAMASTARLQKITRMDPRALGAVDVLRMATLEGANAMGLASSIGSLEAGKRADIIVVDLDSPRVQPVYSTESALVYAANGTSVRHTIVDGRFLMRDRRLLTIDQDQVVAESKKYRDRILASLE